MVKFHTNRIVLFLAVLARFFFQGVDKAFRSDAP